MNNLALKIEFPLKEYQKQVLSNLRNDPTHALFLEQGLGKTRIVLEEIQELGEQLDVILVICPKSLIPTWKYQINLWAADYYANVLKNLNHLVKTYGINLISVDFFSRKRQSFPEMGPNSYLVVDESSSIKTANRMRTKQVLKLGKLCAGRKRILNGTPITQTPFDLYSEMSFLKENFFKQKSFYTFKNHYGETEFVHLNPWTGFNKVVGYRNLKELMDLVKKNSSTLTKAEAELELPDKIYQQIHIEISGDQRKAYDNMHKKCLMEHGEDVLLMFPHVLTKLIKLHQILSGFIQYKDEETGLTKKVLIKNNAKIETLKDLVEFNSGKKILIWVNFVAEAEMVLEALKDTKIIGVYGGIDIQEINCYVEGDKDILVLTQRKGGLGLTLINTDVVIFFSNTYSVSNRMQAEDRCHRIGLKKSVVYYDLITKGTVDEKLYLALLNKWDFNQKLVGWLK